MNIFIDLFNWMISGMAETVEWLANLLPTSPTSEWVNNKPESLVLGHITWFIPFPTMLLHFTGILSAIGVYYIYRIIARWLKVVRS